MISEYLRALRSKVGHDLLMLPAVTAVIREGERMLLARSVGSTRWSLIGGAVEPGEHPADALRREVREELGVGVRVEGISGVYGGPDLIVEYPNGDRVAYVTTAYVCSLQEPPVADGIEIVELGWFTPQEISGLVREPWIDTVLDDALR